MTLIIKMEGFILRGAKYLRNDSQSSKLDKYRAQ